MIQLLAHRGQNETTLEQGETTPHYAWPGGGAKGAQTGTLEIGESQEQERRKNRDAGSVGTGGPDKFKYTEKLLHKLGTSQGLKLPTTFKQYI